MQIILERRINNKLNDTVDYILNTDNGTFNEIIRALRDPKGELDIRYREEIDDPDRTQEIVRISELITRFKELSKQQNIGIQKKRIEKLEKCRGKKDLKKLIKSKYRLSSSEAECILSILNGTKTLSEFIEEKRNSKSKNGILSFLRGKFQKALPEGEESIVDKYCNLINRIISEDISPGFPIDSEDEKNFDKIRTVIYGEREAKHHKIVLGKNDEADWQISPELREYVYQDMPKDLSPEEQAVWIYMKLCKTLSYDDKQVFDTKDNSLNTAFLEGIKPGDKLVCFDFSRIYAKFINEDLGDSIEAKLIGSKGHFLVELVGQDTAAKVEATTAKSHSNEFFKMRMGLPIEGIMPIYDPNFKYSQAIEKITPLVYQDVQSISSYMSMLDNIRKQEDMDREGIEETDILR